MDRFGCCRHLTSGSSPAQMSWSRPPLSRPSARQRMSRWKMQPLGWRRCRKALTRPRGVPGAPEPAGGGRAHGGAPGEGRAGAADAQVPLGCSPLGGGPPGHPGRRQVAEAPGADGEGQGAGVLRTPQPPHRGGACSPRPSRSRRASTSSAMTRWRATSLASIRPRPLGSADCRPRTSSGSCEALTQLKQGGLERVVEAFYIAKMKYEHEARLSTPGQQVGKRAGLGHILDLPLLHHALGEEGRREVHGVRQEDGAH